VVARDSANRWVDNIQTLEGWLKKRFAGNEAAVAGLFKEVGRRPGGRGGPLRSVAAKAALARCSCACCCCCCCCLGGKLGGKGRGSWGSAALTGPAWGTHPRVQNGVPEDLDYIAL
jgi:hypothetical protein